MRKGSTCMRAFYAGRRARDKREAGLQQRLLLARTRRPAKRGRRERRQPRVEPVLLRRDREQRRDLLRVLTMPALAAAEGRVAEPPRARVPDAPEDARAALGIVLLEPPLEEL